MNRDELYPIIKEVLHERWHPYANPGSFWIDQSDGDVQLRIHALTHALCDAIVARLANEEGWPNQPKWETAESPTPWQLWRRQKQVQRDASRAAKREARRG